MYPIVQQGQLMLMMKTKMQCYADLQAETTDNKPFNVLFGFSSTMTDVP